MKMLQASSSLLFFFQVSVNGMLIHDDAHKHGGLTVSSTGVPVAVGTMSCGDKNSGLGYMMFTSVATDVRFKADAANWPGHTAKNFMCVRWMPQTSKWQYDANWGNKLTKATWKDFALQAQDYAVASVDFSKSKVMPLLGIRGALNGLRLGYQGGDVKFQINAVVGSQLIGWDETAAVTPAAKVVLVSGAITCGKKGSGTGLGFVVYTEQKVDVRFKTDQANWNGHAGKNFFCARHTVQGTWQYDSNWGDWAKKEMWKDFTVAPTDQAVAAVDFLASKADPLLGYVGTVSGLKTGYSAGDLSFSVISASAEVGWLTISGTFITNWQRVTVVPVPAPAPVPVVVPAPPPVVVPAPPPAPVAGNRIPLSSGNIFCGDSVSGEGFIMFSEAAVNVRFSGDKADWTAHTAMNFVCVRFKGAAWQYDANWGDVNGGVLWKPFVPIATDVGVHAIDFLDGEIESTRELNNLMHGLKIGFSDSDIGVETRGEGVRNRLTIRATWISFWTTVPTVAMALQATPGSIACGDHGSGLGFVMYTRQPVALRWSSDQGNFVKHAAKNFVCVRFVNSQWQYDANWGNWANHAIWKQFVPAPNDVAVVRLDHATSKLRSFAGSVHTLHGLRLGYSSGDLSFTTSSTDNIEWVTVAGSSLEEWTISDAAVMPILGLRKDQDPMTKTRSSMSYAGMALVCVVGVVIAARGFSTDK
eukprot:TRINITY_DN5463_c2_g1_i3.p1 TRINITY_DN5463_c2_g1~~TRINITY_DN5463_c2_g1_i3.p1  ORF type:complete len:699 (+),score=124.35 TRINITY_DN5463_c2_g1_i3:132-2228(+)